MTSLNNISNLEFIPKGWGSEQIVTNTNLYCQKILTINQDKKISTHFHRLKTEHFLLVSDSEVELIIYENEDIDKYLLNWETLYNGLPNLPSQYEKPKIITMKQWDSILIPIGLRHTAKSLINNAVIIECSTFHQDSDSYRILKGD